MAHTYMKSVCGTIYYRMIQNVWGLVAVIIFYLVILIVGIIAGRKAKRAGLDANSEDVMLAGRNIGMVRQNQTKQDRFLLYCYHH